MNAEAFPRESRCHSCRDPIVWLITAAGKRIPVNADTVRDEDSIFEYGRHVAHFTTCPHAAEHRRRR